MQVSQGMVGQVKARRAAGIIVEMIKVERILFREFSTLHFEFISISIGHFGASGLTIPFCCFKELSWLGSWLKFEVLREKFLMQGKSLNVDRFPRTQEVSQTLGAQLFGGTFP